MSHVDLASRRPCVALSPNRISHATRCRGPSAHGCALPRRRRGPCTHPSIHAHHAGAAPHHPIRIALGPSLGNEASGRSLVVEGTRLFHSCVTRLCSHPCTVAPLPPSRRRPSGRRAGASPCPVRWENIDDNLRLCTTISACAWTSHSIHRIPSHPMPAWRHLAQTPLEIYLRSVLAGRRLPPPPPLHLPNCLGRRTIQSPCLT